MRTPKEFVAKFRKAVEKELRASLDDESGERCVEVGDEEYDFEWRGGCVEYMEEFEPSNEKRTGPASNGPFAGTGRRRGRPSRDVLVSNRM